MPEHQALQLQVLIVDDQRPFQLMLKGILHGIGYRFIDFAQNGEQALSRCQQQQYDLLFIDYNLGAGKNGRQLLEDLRQQKLLHASAICMLVTGENTLPMVLSAIEQEPDDYLMKPFSLSVLRSRLQRLQHKKQQLLPVFQSLQNDDLSAQIAAAQAALSQYPRYDTFLRRLLVQCYLQNNAPSAAGELLQGPLAERRPAWALLLQAKVALQLGQYDDGLQLCQEALTQNKFLLEAYDLSSLCYQQLAQPEQAVAVLTQALDLSPFHSNRLEHMFRLTCQLGLWPEAIQTARQLYENTRRAGSNDPTPLLNYIRSLLSAAAVTTEAQLKNRWQQESVLALQRAHRDEHLLRKLNFNLFEIICQARLDSNDGRLHQAHKQLNKLTALSTTDVALQADLLLLLNQLGEFEAAALLEQQIAGTLSEPVQTLLDAQHRQLDHIRQAFHQFSAQAAQACRLQQGQQAVALYEQALQLAPLNINTQLNLCQALLLAVQSSDKEHRLALVRKLTQHLQQISHQTLQPAQQERLVLLQTEFAECKSTLKLPAS